MQDTPWDAAGSVVLSEVLKHARYKTNAAESCGLHVKSCTFQICRFMLCCPPLPVNVSVYM